MATTTENEILALENRYWQALKNGDADTAIELTAEGCIVVGAQGVTQLDREMLEQMMKQPNYVVHDYEIRDVAVSMLGEDVAVVAYRVRENLEVDGKPVTLEAADASTWVRRPDGRWACSLHTESVLGDPFGRDRRKIQPK